MVRSGAEVADLLRTIAASGDDWFRVWESEDGHFWVSDPTGSVAAIEIESHWVEVRAGRPMSAGSWAIGSGFRSDHSLLRLHISNDAPAMVMVCGRVYLDGFSLHALICTTRDVLTLAGSRPPEPELTAAFDKIEPSPNVVESPGERRPQDEPSNVEPDSAETLPQQPVHPIADAAVVSPEPAASLPIDAAATPVAGSSTVESSAPASNEGGTPDVAPAPDAEPAPPVPGTPIVPTWSSSVGATVQIPRIPKTEGMPRTEDIAPPSDAAPIPEHATPATCRRCGAEVQPGERFCITCGAPQEATPPSSVQQTVARRSEPDTVIWRRPRPGDNQCARCGEANPENNRYCQSCGATLQG